LLVEMNIKVNHKEMQCEGVTGFSWIGTSGGLLWTWQWPIEFHRRLAEQPTACRVSKIVWG
jgi:hypothetical protein